MHAATELERSTQVWLTTSGSALSALLCAVNASDSINIIAPSLYVLTLLLASSSKESAFSDGKSSDLGQTQTY